MVVIVLLRVWLSDIELGRFDNSQLGTVVIVLFRVWLRYIELGRFDSI